MNSVIKIIDRFGAGFDRDAAEKSGYVPGSNIVIPVPYAIASLWLLDKALKKGSKLSLVLEMLDPSGKQLTIQTHDLEVPLESPRLSLNFNMQGLVVNTTGIYTLKAVLSAHNKVIAEAEYPYEVDLDEQEPK